MSYGHVHVRFAPTDCPVLLSPANNATDVATDGLELQATDNSYDEVRFYLWALGDAPPSEPTGLGTLDGGVWSYDTESSLVAETNYLWYATGVSENSSLVSQGCLAGFRTFATAAETDPLFASVWSLKHFDDGVLSDVIPGRVWTSYGIPVISSGAAKFGAGAGSGANLLENNGAIALDDIPPLSNNVQDYCVEGWVFFATIGVEGRFYSTFGTASFNFSLGIKSDGKFFLRNTGGSTDLITSSVTAVAGVYYAYALERVGNVMTLLIDGVPQGSYTMGSFGIDNVVSYFGQPFAGTVGVFNGLLDETRITLAARGYSGGYTPRTTPFPNA